MTIGDMFIKMGFQVDKSSEKSVQDSAMQLKSFLRKAIGVVGISLSVAGLKDLAATAAEFKAMDAQFNQTFGGIEDTAKNSLEKVAEYGGMATSRLKSSFTSLAAFAKTGGMSAAESVEFASDAMTIAADSAAYFDRSIEETADIMKRLMKGNFTLDDNLGFQSTQATRDATAAKLAAQGKVSGAKYQNLDSYEQQLVILEQIKEANDAMGATGQAKKESQEWTNMIGNMSAYMKELKAGIGRLALPFALKIVTMLSNALQKATTWVNKIVDSLGDFEQEGTDANRIMKVFTRGLDIISSIAGKVVSGVGKIIDVVGGLRNALKILGVVIAAVTALMVIDKIQKMGGAIAILSKAFAGLNIPVLLVIAAIVALFLIIEDFVGFLQGRDSAIGLLFEQMGIDADGVRDKVFSAIEIIKGKFDEFVAKIKGIPEKIGNLGETIAGKFDIKGALDKALAGLERIGAIDAAKKIGEDVMTILQTLSTRVPGMVSAIFGFAESVGNALIGILGAVWNFLSPIADEMVPRILTAITNMYDTLTALLDPLMGMLQGMIEILTDLLSGDWSELGKDLVDYWGNLKKAVQTAVSGIVKIVTDGLSGLPGKALSWGKDMISNFIEGIKSAPEAIGGAVSGIAEGIKNRLGHSTPKEGPLKDDDKWMPDMIDNFVRGINDGREKLRGVVDGITDVISNVGSPDVSANFDPSEMVNDFINVFNAGKEQLKKVMYDASEMADRIGDPGVWRNMDSFLNMNSMPQPQLATAMYGGNTSTIINQNNSFVNTFNGGDNMRQAAEAQRRNNNDATKQLANALVGGR